MMRLVVSPEMRRNSHPAQELLTEPLVDDFLVDGLHDEDSLGGVKEEVGHLGLGVGFEFLE